MKVLILVILCVLQAEVSSKKALLFNLETRSLVDVCRKNGDEKYPPYLTACPASTPQEIQFNKDFSLGKRSVFSRLMYAKNESARNIVVDFCEKSVKPTMLYNMKNDEYEIGYELYFEDGKINTTKFNKTYHHYRPVNAKRNENVVLSILQSGDRIIKYEDEKDVKFNFTEGSRNLVFHWIEVLSIKKSKHKKSITLDYYKDLWWRKMKNLRDRCENYHSSDDRMYSQRKQNIYISDTSVAPSLYKGNPDIGCGHPNGCLEKYQIVPLWLFDSSSARLASCSHMNLIPVWETIAEQLRKVDLYILSILENLHASVTYGVSKILKTKPASTENSNITRTIYLLDPKHHRKVPIPKIMYRIIKMPSKLLDDDLYTAAIIIHNDPTADPKVDKLCTHRSPSGWDKITNDDPSTGLTYVCRVTKRLGNQLGVYEDLKFNKMQPLDLDTVPYYRNYAHQRLDYDETVDINEHFEKLVNESKVQV